MNACVTRTLTKIEANPLLVKGKSDSRIMRVAAYCRVSTDDEDQLNSYQAQIAYYTDAIAKRPNSTFAGIYADATVIIGLKQNPTYGRRFGPIFLLYRAFCGAKRRMPL